MNERSPIKCLHNTWPLELSQVCRGEPSNRKSCMYALGFPCRGSQLRHPVLQLQGKPRSIPKSPSKKQKSNAIMQISSKAKSRGAAALETEIPFHVANAKPSAGGRSEHGPQGPRPLHPTNARNSAPLHGLRFGRAFPCPDSLCVLVSWRRGFLNKDLKAWEEELLGRPQNERPGAGNKRQGPEWKHIWRPQE